MTLNVGKFQFNSKISTSSNNVDVTNVELPVVRDVGLDERAHLCTGERLPEHLLPAPAITGAHPGQVQLPPPPHLHHDPMRAHRLRRLLAKGRVQPHAAAPRLLLLGQQRCLSRPWPRHGRRREGQERGLPDGQRRGARRLGVAELEVERRVGEAANERPEGPTTTARPQAASVGSSARRASPSPAAATGGTGLRYEVRRWAVRKAGFAAGAVLRRGSLCCCPWEGCSSWLLGRRRRRREGREGEGPVLGVAAVGEGGGGEEKRLARPAREEAGRCDGGGGGMAGSGVVVAAGTGM
ncbi:hypothetical protein PR202_gb20455 [Eleusine coracana subsp. coracana]|uniref:Uncharacterized protein n=1 Tax=Eleusine coracana subsp. coracana TaxID=191504 RepID=A0AAV5FCB1_ELECO|nr:hypothetical protein PR202_gb20455 [Eleusine coracana subsp. coracana]